MDATFNSGGETALLPVNRFHRSVDTPTYPLRHYAWPVASSPAPTGHNLPPAPTSPPPMQNDHRDNTGVLSDYGACINIIMKHA